MVSHWKVLEKSDSAELGVDLLNNGVYPLAGALEGAGLGPNHFDERRNLPRGVAKPAKKKKKKIMNLDF